MLPTITKSEIKLIFNIVVEVRDSLKTVIEGLNRVYLLVNNIYENNVNGEDAHFLSDRLVKEGNYLKVTEHVIKSKEQFIQALNDSVNYYCT